MSLLKPWWAEECLSHSHGHGAVVLPVFIPSVRLFWVSAAELRLLNSSAERLEIFVSLDIWMEVRSCRFNHFYHKLPVQL